MKIVLINPPFYYSGELEYLTQNLGLGYLASSLGQRGHKVEALDALALGRERRERITIDDRRISLYGLPYRTISEMVPSDTDMIGITAPFSNHATIIENLAVALRKRFPNIPIVVGGVYPSTQPQRALESAVDYAVVGEGESAICELAAGKKAQDIPGVWYKRNGEIVDNGRSVLIPELDSIPFPARHLFPMDIYMSISPRGTPGKKSATVVTSRGCPFACDFCSIHPVYTKKWRARSAENVLAEIDILIEKFGVNSIEFEDDNLTLNRERAKKIFEGLIDRPVGWTCSNGLRVDTLDDELLALIKKSGGSHVHLAIESGDPDMLKLMNKKIDLGKVVDIARACKKIGLYMVGFFIIGHPGETKKSFKKTLAFAKKLRAIGMSDCGVHIATPYPGTDLMKLCKEKGYLIKADADRKIMMPGDIHIVTPEFKKQDVIDRMHILKAATGMIPDLSSGLQGFIDLKIKPRLAEAGLSNRLFTSLIPETDMSGFFKVEELFNGITYRWSTDEAAIETVISKKPKWLVLLASSNRLHKAGISINGKKVGEINLTRDWTEYYILLKDDFKKGPAEIKFSTDTTTPFDIMELEETRKLGFMLSWIELESADKFSSPLPFRYLKKNVAKIPDKFLSGFYPAEKGYKNRPFRWTRGKSSIVAIVPPAAKSLFVIAGSMHEHAVEVFIDGKKIGEMQMRHEWNYYRIPFPESLGTGRCLVEFSTATVNASEFGVTNDTRDIGFLLGGFAFSAIP